MKFKTVSEGQQAVVLNHLGQGKLVIGPERLFLFRERFYQLRSNTADRFGYIAIQENSGSIIHKPGPCQIFHNILEFRNCESKNASCIDANHVLVVYKRLKGGEAQRWIIQGPAVFIPDAEEWAHEFVWHGADPENKTRMLPGSNKFTQLPIIPDNFYYNVREVRTSDDTMLTVKVMLFYEIVDILKMLDATHDPIADLINALCADVISFVGTLTYQQFIEKTSQLSSLDTYPHLQQRAERIGFKIEKVVFRGYHASDQLQEMQNTAIESHTQLRLQREIEEQEQKLVNFKLNQMQKRSIIQQSMQLKRQLHQQKIAELTQKHLLEKEKLTLNHKLALSSMETKVNAEIKEAEDSQMIVQLANLSAANIDVTKYLTLQYDLPATEEIRIAKMTSGFSN
ncbi:hypothetical protein Bpfe_001512 [Biomphalaria pfeifferi]|uniref:Band 7 domain-containing protein n=1 Tax=Biomphalaria pfeifferi TaxID=112525 RepID=A0AAD8CC39_BIOPF|nr:hypothetical protein Bpfe_001512 [Biomphalaria pfeifferi]